MKRRWFIRLRLAGQLEAVQEWMQEHTADFVLLLDHELTGALKHGMSLPHSSAERSTASEDLPGKDPAQQEAAVYLCLPDVARQSRIASVERMVHELPENAGLAVKNPDELGMLLQAGYRGPLIGDAFLYAYNQEAILFYQELFPAMQFILSDELTDRELRELTKQEPDRFIYKIYGYQPLMITNQCMSRNYTDCRGKMLDLKDGKGNRFIAVSSCGQCSSTVYNGICTSMLDKLEEIPYRNLLIDLTIEDKQETAQILRGKIPQEATRGHHYKGID